MTLVRTSAENREDVRDARQNGTRPDVVTLVGDVRDANRGEVRENRENVRDARGDVRELS